MKNKIIKIKNLFFPGYPPNPKKEDIFLKSQKVTLDEIPNEEPLQHQQEKDSDVPGAELDDRQEEIGSEDEENNYYSLGGDNHDD